MSYKKQILENVNCRCRRMVQIEESNGNITRDPCPNPPKYLVSIYGEMMSFEVCIKHAKEFRSDSDAIVEPLDPKLDILM